MSSGKSRSSLLDVLIDLGVVPKDKEAEVEKEIEAHPDMPTADLILDLGLAKAEDIKRAEEIQRELGSHDLLKERLKAADSKLSDLGAAGASLDEVVDRLSKK